MLDTGMPSLDNNAIDTDSPVKRDELQEDTTAPVPAPTEGLDDADVVATLSEDTPNLAGNTIKSKQPSEIVDLENVNEESIKSSATSTSTTTSEEEEEATDGKDESNDEINESIVVNQSAEDSDEEFKGLLEKRQELEEVIAEKQMQALVDSVGEKLTMADADEERFADEVEKMVSTDHVDENDKDKDETIEEATQKPSNQEKQSLREDVSSSDEEEDNENEEIEKSDITKNEGLESEWGGIVSLDDDKNILTNEIDVYESVPIDLSNDIAINEQMADQGAPINPNAEIFDVEELTSGRDGEESRRLEVLAAIK